MYTINAHGASLLSKKSYKSSFGCETLLMETALAAVFSGQKAFDKTDLDISIKPF
jgi:hypothetical protein